MLADDHLDNFTLLSSVNLDEAHSLVSDIFCDHRLKQLDRSQRINYRHWYPPLEIRNWLN